MKKLQPLVWLSLLVASQLTNAQNIIPALDQDPVFAKVVTRRILYPPKPATRAVYGRFYAGFSINEQGHIKDIAVLCPKMSAQVSKQYGFDAAILKGLKQMPPLQPNLAGCYILPVAFCFTNYKEGPLPIIPTNVLPTSLTTGERIALREVRIYASSPSSGWLLKNFPDSRQIGQQ